MENNRKQIGSAFEKKAGAYLEKQGYRIRQYNYRCKTGEIDIIAEDGDTLVFCEVKYRRDDRGGHPLEAVTKTKQRRISRAACYYLATHPEPDRPCRFDVVGILGEEIRLVRNAFAYMEK